MNTRGKKDIFIFITYVVGLGLQILCFIVFSDYVHTQLNHSGYLSKILSYIA